jgi:hypothetical protein
MLRDAARLVRLALPFIIIAAVIALALRSFSTNAAPAVQAAAGRLETAEAERNATAARAEAVVARAAEARVATKPAIARVESLRAEHPLVNVPPLVTERIEADSVAISALSVALTWDTRAAAAQNERLAAEMKVNDAARITIAALEHERRPMCGRRCGMLIGAASVVALGMVFHH